MSKQSQFDELVSVSPADNPQGALYYSQMPPVEYEPEAPTVPLTHYIWVLRRMGWKILAFVAVCTLATLIVSTRLKPLYESTVTLNIDRYSPDEVIGDGSARNDTQNDADQFLATQIKLIQSDAVLRPVAERYHLLDQEGQLSKKDSENAQRIARAPIALGRLKVSRPANTYLLLISYRSPDAALSADVANAIANSYLNETYDIRIRSSASLSSFMGKQLDELKAKMEKSSLTLAEFEKDLDVVNPEEKTNILSARLLQLNTEYTTAQGDRMQKEAAWKALQSGSIEAVQVSSQGESLAHLNETLDQARQRFALVKSTYGSSHPEYKKAAAELAEIEKQYEDTRKNIAARIGVEYKEAVNREQMLQKAVASTKAEWDQVNARSFQYDQLKREADADKSLYDELVKKIKEADINSGFQNNNVRVADYARPAVKKIFPNTRLNVLLAMLFSTLFGVATAILFDSLDTTLRDPNEASRFLGAEVIGTIPADKESITVGHPSGSKGSTLALMPNKQATKDGYYRAASTFEESIRTLRNTILLSDFEGRLRSIMITSATPGEGKTTLAIHLALSNATRGKKTLLVDSDLRRPSIHSRLGVAAGEGLSNVLTEDMRWQQLATPLRDIPNLSLLQAGPGSHRAADLIGPRLSSLLDEFSKEYELVILDSPPLPGFAECLQLAKAADGVLIVAKAAETKRKAVLEVVTTLQRLRANIVGVVLNQVTKSTAADSYGYSSYHGKYSYSGND